MADFLIAIIAGCLDHIAILNASSPRAVSSIARVTARMEPRRFLATPNASQSSTQVHSAHHPLLMPENVPRHRESSTRGCPPLYVHTALYPSVPRSLLMSLAPSCSASLLSPQVFKIPLLAPSPRSPFVHLFSPVVHCVALLGSCSVLPLCSSWLLLCATPLSCSSVQLLCPARLLLRWQCSSVLPIAAVPVPSTLVPVQSPFVCCLTTSLEAHQTIIHACPVNVVILFICFSLCFLAGVYASGVPRALVPIWLDHHARCCVPL